VISDTHTKHRQVQLPESDVLIHAGDFTNVGEMHDVIDFNQWLGENKHKYKHHPVVICGNHEKSFDPRMKQYDPSMKNLITNAALLDNSSIEIEGWKIYGSPIQPAFMGWAFNRNRGEEIRREWNLIPEDTDILITHGPAYGTNDKIHPKGSNLGCLDLRNRIQEIPSIKLHIAGHLHAGRNYCKYKDVTYLNASILNEAYKFTNKPYIVTLYEDGSSLVYEA